MDLTLLLLVVFLGQQVAGLKLLRINVPAYTLRGKSALLECRYDLGEDKLYSMSWYKDHEEFYRYVPRGEPKKHSYGVEGVKVDHRQSDHQQVLLQDASLHTSGQYKCEVSAEAPSFNSVSAEADMEVVVLPQNGPTITGEEKVYATGDVLSLNCTSGKSHPVATLKWFINSAEMRGDSGIGFKLGHAARRDAHHPSFRGGRRVSRDAPRMPAAGERVAAATTAAGLSSPRAKHRQPWPVDSTLSVTIARRDQPRSNRRTLDAMGWQTERKYRRRKKRTRGKRRGEEGVASRRTASVRKTISSRDTPLNRSEPGPRLGSSLAYGVRGGPVIRSAGGRSGAGERARGEETVNANVRRAFRSIDGRISSWSGHGALDIEHGAWNTSRWNSRLEIPTSALQCERE